MLSHNLEFFKMFLLSSRQCKEMKRKSLSASDTQKELNFSLYSVVALILFGTVDVIVPSSASKSEDRLSFCDVSHNRPHLAPAAWKLTKTDATSLKNISGLCRADPASTGPRNSSIRENSQWAAAPQRSSIRHNTPEASHSSILEAPEESSQTQKKQKHSLTATVKLVSQRSFLCQ